MIRDDRHAVPLARRAVPRHSPAHPSMRGRALPPPRRRSPAMLVLGGLLVAGGGITAVQLLRNDDAAAPPPTTAPSSGPRAAARISVPPEIRPSAPGVISTLRGLVDEAVSLKANGVPITIEPGGQFRVLLPQDTAAVHLAAADAAGLVTETEVVVTDTPQPPSYPTTVAVHVSAAGWADPTIRQQVIDLVRGGQVNAVQLDIKDEYGAIGYASAVPMGNAVGATAAPQYDAAEALAELHGLGVRVIGRLVCFLDPLAAGWAWNSGRGDLVVTNPGGSAPLTNDYGAAAFTNLAHPEIRQYQIDLAVEAATLGFDEILYDYVRRPEGELSTMRFAGLDIPPEVSVARFVADTRDALAGVEAQLGVSVFGISASRPLPTAQDVGLLAPLVDYVSPMVYPSHWGPGEYGVADPNAQPGDIVRAALADFDHLIDGSGAAMVPWLQDFSDGGVEYGDAEVRAQIAASGEVGSDGFLLWNANSTYHAGALDPRFPPDP